MKRRDYLKAQWALCTEPEKRAAQEYVDWCKTQLGLPHWNIYIATVGHCDDDAYADCDVNPTRWMAKVRISRAWVTLDSWTRANALLHECLHVSHYDLTNVIRHEVRLTLPTKAQAAFNVIEARSDLEAERMVDQLATALTDALGAVKAWDSIHASHVL